MRICKNNLTDQLRRLFNANPLRIPEAIYQPLLVLEITNNRPYPLGQLKDLIKGTFEQNIEITTTNVAELSGEQTRKVDSQFGLDILGNFIKAFGIEPTKINLALKKTKKLSFSFSDVKHRRFSPLRLGKVLSEHNILADSNNMFIKKIMNDKKSKLAIVTDIIVSNNFSVKTFDESDKDADIDIPAIEDYLANAKIDVKVESLKKSEIKFNKTEALTFAFSCVEIIIDHTGRFTSGDWITKLKSRTIGDKLIEDLSDNELEYQAKIMFDDDEARPLLIE